MKKRCAILQSNYIPWKGYFDIINSVDEFVVFDCVQLTRGFRNRNRVKTTHGVQWLTIPLQKEHRPTIDSVRVADPEWRKRHWASIVTNFSRAQYFSDYSPLFKALFLEGTEERLSDINVSFIKAICKILGIETPIRLSSEYEIEGDKNTRLINICKQANADIYLSGRVAECYMDKELFEENGITIEWMDYSDYPEYRQLFPPFDHYVTVLDLIFNEGPEASTFMKSFAEPSREPDRAKILDDHAGLTTFQDCLSL